jgi:hypothetical protein
VIDYLAASGRNGWRKEGQPARSILAGPVQF